ncbi:MAG: hypothetical protein WBY71_06945, partial [Nitrososphaeraceae archaeon]
MIRYVVVFDPGSPLRTISNTPKFFERRYKIVCASLVPRSHIAGAPLVSSGFGVVISYPLFLSFY